MPNWAPAGSSARLRFITRARRMGLSCEQITALIPVWGRRKLRRRARALGRLVDHRLAEIAQRIAELEQFSAQLNAVRASLDAEPPLAQCRNGITCCVPESAGPPVAIELVPRR